MTKKFIGLTALFASLCFSCEDLTELNKNPNGVQPDVVNPNLVLPSVLTETAKSFVNQGYGNVAGVMQHTQKDGWFSEHNNYDWTSQDWSEFYAILADNQLVYDRSEELGYEFHQGVALVMKSLVFGMVTDLWGDAPYTNALKGEQLGDNLRPTFDTQETIYAGILADLEEANTILSKGYQEYEGIIASVDAVYGDAGDEEVAKWRKLANSLALRYYMRISDKKPDVAKAGIEKIMGDQTRYPVILDQSDDALVGFDDKTTDTAWPNNTRYDASESNYSRTKMCATLVDKLQQLNDPRIAVWANKVEIPLVVDASFPAGTDEIVEVDGKRYRHLSPDKVGDDPVDTDPDYVGLPPAMGGIPILYNLNPTANQGAYNVHVSQLNSIYKEASGDLLKARLMTATEVHFILAEAALKGWSVGGTETEHYNKAIQTSFQAWDISGEYADYIAQPDVAYNEGDTDEANLEKIMTQKWISSWTAATEAWFDYRRTGLPDLHPGSGAKRSQLPVRFYYMSNELLLNATSANAALDRLDATNGYVQADGKNSAWAKPWIIQGTGKPW
jgi:hypothetical protein